MKNRLITGVLLIILIGICIILGNFILNKTKSQGLVSPDGKNIIQQVTKQNVTATPIKSGPTLTPTPIVFNFDKTTNLKTELDSINPEVLDSDFNNLKNTINQL